MDEHDHDKADIVETPSHPDQDLAHTQSPSVAPDDASVSAVWGAATRAETPPSARSAATKSIAGRRSLILTAAKPREDFAAFEEVPAASAHTSRGWRRLALPAVSLM